MSLPKSISIHANGKFVFLFLVAHFIISELHEQAHIQAGYLLCGCYGPRDFVNWAGCHECDTQYGFLPVAAGPLFSYFLYFTGTWLILKRPAEPTRISIGFILLFAPVPFARFFTALMGGGDEKVFFSYFLNNLSHARIPAIILTFLTCIIPVILVFRSLKKRRWLWISVFCLSPMIVGVLYQRHLLNKLLEKGWLSKTHFLGTPDLILVHWLFLLIIFFLLRKWVNQLFVNRELVNKI